LDEETGFKPCPLVRLIPQIVFFNEVIGFDRKNVSELIKVCITYKLLL
jgi:hypothetical protein